MLNRAVPYAVVWSFVAATSAPADVIGDWNEKAVGFVTARNVPPPQAERAMAMVHAAMFDAVNSVDRRYLPVVTQTPSPATASREAAAATAAGGVLVGLYPGALELKNTVAAYLVTLPDGDAKAAGIRLGEAVAARVLDARVDDGSQAPDAYRPKTQAGVYVPTPITIGSTPR